VYNHEPQDYHCPFCAIARGEECDTNKRSDIVLETSDVIAYVSPKWWVNNPGNVMIITHAHVENIYDITEELLSKVYVVGKQVAFAMKDTYGCDGVSFRQHNEPAGNQDVWHFHLHLFPRWDGDELYSNHNNKRWNTPEERLPYVEKLRTYFEKSSSK
jgi:histidine triad (HIT) family protein